MSQTVGGMGPRAPRDPDYPPRTRFTGPRRLGMRLLTLDDPGATNWRGQAAAQPPAANWTSEREEDDDPQHLACGGQGAMTNLRPVPRCYGAHTRWASGAEPGAWRATTLGYDHGMLPMLRVERFVERRVRIIPAW